MSPAAVMRVVWFFGARVAGSYENCARFSVQVPIHESVLCAAIRDTREPAATRGEHRKDNECPHDHVLRHTLSQPRVFVYKPF